MSQEHIDDQTVADTDSEVNTSSDVDNNPDVVSDSDDETILGDSGDVQFLGTAVVDNNAIWIDPEWRRLRSCLSNGVELTAGYTLSILEQELDGTDMGNKFFHITEIFEKLDGNVVLRGLNLHRVRICEGLDNWKNELAVVMSIPDSRGDADLLQYHATMDLPDVFALRTVVFTNAPFPQFSYREQATQYDSIEEIEDHAVLTCRWVHITQCDITRPVATINGYVVRSITEDECRQIGGSPVRGKTVRINYRGVDVRPDARRKYADVCSGAGGSVSGAIRAGFNVVWCLDQDEKSLASLRLNVDQQTRILHMTVQRFVEDTTREGFSVEILHVSFPCCFFSSAHTVPGKNDDHNSAVIFSLGELLDKVRPRILTFENVEGLLRKDSKTWFHRVIGIITSRGYSVRASIDNLANHGNPQRRKRLIVIASCPGESLPGPVPKTHGPGTARPEYATIADVIAPLSGMQIEDHMRACSERNKPPYNAHRPLRGCLMTTGYPLHPHGNRSFNLQELAALQTFPLTWRFTGGKTDIRKQIGNAVPSISALQLFQHVDQHITASDAKLDTPVPIVDLTL